MEFKYELLKFGEYKDQVRCRFMKNWYFDIPKATLSALGKWEITKDKSLEIEETAEVMKRLIDDGMNNLTNAISNNKTIYLHKGCGIPLIGSNTFGIVDRGTSLIEIKPLTSCNLKCIHCSVSQGGDDKEFDFLVEADYLVEEVKKVLDEKELKTPEDKVEIHFSCHGEPFLYGDIIYLLKKLSEIPAVTQITTDTNGTILTEDFIDELADAGMTRINLSIHSLDQKKASTIAGGNISVKHTMKIAEYIAKHPKMNLLIAPVWMPGLNDEDIKEVIKYAKKLKATLGIQNYLNYKGGRYIQKQLDWDKFKSQLEDWEKEFNTKLLMDMPKDFCIRKVKQIQKPFKKGQTIDAIIICHGHNPRELVAKSENRTITLPNCDKKIGQKVRIRLTRHKHNIFYGETR
jgi:uncharacterized protein